MKQEIKWISVKKKLPDDRMYHLVACHYPNFANFDIRIGVYYKKGKGYRKGWISQDGYSLVHVTHYTETLPRPSESELIKILKKERKKTKKVK